MAALESGMIMNSGLDLRLCRCFRPISRYWRAWGVYYGISWRRLGRISSDAHYCKYRVIRRMLFVSSWALMDVGPLLMGADMMEVVAAYERW